MEVQSRADNLTGLGGRDFILEATSRALESASGLTALVVLDIDGLRNVNDVLGVDAGDAIVSELSRRLSDSVNPGDSVARTGGDEFVVLCTNVKDAEEANTRVMRVSWSAARSYAVKGREVRLTISLGVAIAGPGGFTAEGLLADAGVALLTAKSGGGGRAVTFTDDLRLKSQERFEIQADLRAALENQEFQLYYQGQVALPGLQIFGAEALLRWNHGKRGWVSPADFVPVAEDSGLIIPLGHWVMRSAAAQLAEWNAAGREMEVSINIAAAQLAQPDLLFQVRDVIAETGIKPHCLTLEVTESQVMRHLDIALPVMGSLRTLGVRLSIDDFGTGYASLTQLRQIPADELKLDRSFIVNLAEESRDRAIVTAAINMAHALDLKVVAEGVETQEQFALLQEMGCDVIQGFLLTRPVPADQMPETVSLPG